MYLNLNNGIEGGSNIIGPVKFTDIVSMDRGDQDWGVPNEDPCTVWLAD